MFWLLRNLFGYSQTTQTVDANTLVITPPNVAPISDVSVSANALPPIFIDTETTGLNKEGTDEVLEIAIVDAGGTALLNTLVRPMRNTAWPNAQAIHGISPQDVANAPTWDELLPKIAAICAGKIVVFYNAPFDTSFFPTGFFSSVACAMRRYSELNPDVTGWKNLADAATESGYFSTGAYHRALEDALACRHVWLFGIAALEKTYPRITDPQITAELALDTGARIPLRFNTIFKEELRFVNVEDRCSLWTKDDRDEINVYRPHTSGGRGKIATLSKADNREMAELLAAGYRIEMWLSERGNNKMIFEVLSIKMHAAPALPDTPVTYSPIDDDIFECFIAHPSGIYNASGEPEEFYKVEEIIAHLCKERGGRYYKTKAKGAKFAVIMAPSCHTANVVRRLQQSGYKVTTFDRAVVYFGLTHLWDFPRYLSHVNSLKNCIDNPM